MRVFLIGLLIFAGSWSLGYFVAGPLGLGCAIGTSPSACALQHTTTYKETSK